MCHRYVSEPAAPGPCHLALNCSCARAFDCKTSGLKASRSGDTLTPVRPESDTAPLLFFISYGHRSGSRCANYATTSPSHLVIQLVTKYADWLHFLRLLTKISVDPMFFSSLVNHIVDPDTQIVGNYARMLVRPSGSDPTAPGGCAY